MNTSLAIAIALVGSPLLYLLVASWSDPAKSEDDFLFAERSIKPSDYVDTTFMYAVQLSTITIFCTWGYIYGLWTLAVPLFWLLGYILFSSALRLKKVQEAFFFGNAGTLHTFLGKIHGRQIIIPMASLVTLLAIAGPAMFEPFFAAGAITKGLGIREELQLTVQVACFIAFVGIAAVYLLIGGFRTVVLTNKWQLTVGYTSFNLFLAIFFFEAPNIPSPLKYWLLVVMLIASLILFLCSLAILIIQGKFDLFAVLSHFLSCLGYGYALSLLKGTGDFHFTQFFEEQFSKPFPVIAMISLFIANAFYQFVDVGQWQRLLSIRLTDSSDNASARQAIRRVSNANFLAGLTSSISWSVAVVLGVALKVAYPKEDALTIFGTFLNRLPPFDQPLIAFLFVTAIIAIMFSTLDALCSAVSFTVDKDLVSPIFKNFNTLTLARIVTLLILALYICYFLFMREFSGDNFDAILYASWSLQIGLLPAVAAAILGKNQPIGAILSILFGAFGALYLIVSGQPDKVFEQAAFLALTAAAVGFAIGAAVDYVVMRSKSYYRTTK